MKRILLPALIVLGFISCNFMEKKKPVSNTEDRLKMIESDIAFAKMSEEKGMKTAFLEYIDSNGVLLRPNREPLTGANAIDFLSQMNDSTNTLTWEPKSGIIAQSGDLGFTYGIYTLMPKGKDSASYGTYVSIWKKQPDGKWKFILDSGNDGIGEPE